jgi:hypothetical protein
MAAEVDGIDAAPRAFTRLEYNDVDSVFAKKNGRGQTRNTGANDRNSG